ncbi:MAG: ABC transporter permease, partial [Desulfovibrionaceae bacterium]|nr:ABC transporter permease [Desulfovibrionaceae bacterium]
MAFNRPNILAALGAPVIDFTQSCGALFLFTVEAFRCILARHMVRRVMWQIYVIGAKSFWLIMLIGLFTGMVLGLQGYYALVKFGADGFLGAAVSLSLIRELGPVLTAIMVTGRAGSSITAEIGVMRISDQ